MVPGVRQLPVAETEDMMKLFATGFVRPVSASWLSLPLVRRKPMRHLVAAVLVSLGLSSATLAASFPQSSSPDKPCRVRRVYVAELGDSGEAGRFRRELQRQLQRRRFTLAARAEEAEGVLTGKFSLTGSDRDGKIVFDPAELKDRAGARLWHGSFYFTHKGRLSFLSGGSIKDAASKVAANLRGACR
jgi:hypothetical protein